MSGKRTFEIAFVGLKPGIHEFNYVVDDKFFASRWILTCTSSIAAASFIML